MTGKAFINKISNSESDILQTILNILQDLGSDYCIIGGLAVNAYVEPVVSLDLDLIVATKDLDKVLKAAIAQGLRVEYFEHSINLTSTRKKKY